MSDPKISPKATDSELSQDDLSKVSGGVRTDVKVKVKADDAPELGVADLSSFGDSSVKIKVK